MPGGVWVVCRCGSRVPASQGRVGERAIANSVGLANHQVVEVSQLWSRRGQLGVCRSGRAGGRSYNLLGIATRTRAGGKVVRGLW